MSAVHGEGRGALAAFDVVARTSQGLLVAESIRGIDAASVAAEAARRGWQLLSCERRSGWRDALLRGLSAGHAKRLDVGAFSVEFAALLKAGLSIREALGALAHAQGDRAMVLRELEAAIAEGLPLSQAMQRTGAFPALLVAAVTTSERTGDLSVALDRFAEHHRQIRELRDKVIGAAVYPMALLAVGSLVVFFLLAVVVPRFATLIEGTRAELPWSSMLLLSWGQWVAARRDMLAVVLAVGVVSFVVAFRRAWASGALAGWLERLPGVGAGVREFRRAQLFQTCSMLVRGGVPAVQALQLGTSLLGPADRASLAQATRRIAEGRPISTALGDAGIADRVAHSLLAVGERSGSLAESLQQIAEFKESRLHRYVDIMKRLIEPVLMVAIGLVIGAIVVLMYLPIFDLASSLQ